MTSDRPIDNIRTFYNLFVMELVGYESAADLDAIFSALADPTRRAILTRLSKGNASVAEIAAPFRMSQPAVSRHLKVLERAGLVKRGVDRQRRPAALRADNMAAAVDWLNEFREFWGKSFDQLDQVLLELKPDDKRD